MSERCICHIGLGYWGKNILRNLYQLQVLHTACDSDPGKIDEMRGQFPDVAYSSSLEHIWKDPAIRAVTIATPASNHYEMVKLALLSNKDVFVEKPLALTVREGEELVSLAARKEKILMVGHILQYHPAILKLKEIISSGMLGKFQYIYSNRLNLGKLRTEENILWSFAPHDISIMLMLLEDEPVSVSAFGGDYLSRGNLDTTLTTLEFRGGVRGHIFVSWLHPYKEQKLIVVGSKGMAVFDDTAEKKLGIYPHTIEWKHGRVPVAHKAEFIPVETGKEEPLRAELQHFMHCLQTGESPRTDGSEGLRVLKILEMAEKSLLISRSAKGDAYQEHKVSVHESACVEEGVHIGEGTKIWHFSHVLKGAHIGKECIIGQNVMVGSDVTIGDRCKIQNNVSIYTGVTLEDEVFCGPSCVFTNVYNPRAFIERKHEFMQTIVKRGATIGANATVVCGTAIGRYAMVGAGAVVKNNVPDYAMVVGVPARQIGWVCKCGVTLEMNARKAAHCTSCGNRYELKKGILSVKEERQ